MGASSGLFHLQERRWDQETLRALGLPSEIFPEVRESGDRFGGLCSEAARAAGLPEGLPVFVGMGDNQASFLGSVAYRNDTALVNVGTGAQVARYVERAYHAPPLETRPFPRGGYLLVFAGLCGGRSYAILERFFRQVGAEVLGVERQDKVYAVMNALAEKAPKGADGLRCDPYFAGSRPDPTRRATWTGVSEKNFTPAHAVRALLEGMARSFREGYDLIRATAGGDCARLVGAGNGLRENAVLAGIVSEEFGMPLSVPAHREEAAYGAALAAGVGAGVWPDLAAAGKIIRFQ
jgi:sugar (pentulose or hexulose) kinase